MADDPFAIAAKKIGESKSDSDDPFAIAAKNLSIDRISAGKGEVGTAGTGRTGARLKGSTSEYSVPGWVRAFAGAGSGLTDTITALGTFGGMLDPAGVRKDFTEATRPESAEGQMGRFGEEIAEFKAFPDLFTGAGGLKGVGGAAARAGKEALRAGTLGGIHEGAGGAAGGAILGGGLSAAAEGVPMAIALLRNKAVRQGLARKLPFGVGTAYKTYEQWRKFMDTALEEIKPAKAPAPKAPDPFRPTPAVRQQMRYGGPAQPDFSPPAPRPAKTLQQRTWRDFPKEKPPEPPKAPDPFRTSKATAQKMRYGGPTQPDFSPPTARTAKLRRTWQSLPTVQEETLPASSKLISEARPAEESAADEPKPKSPSGGGLVPIERPYPAFENPVGEVKPQYAKAARTVKARALARWLKTGGLPYADAVHMDAEQWAMAAKGAGVTMPSKESIVQALEELQKLDQK